MFALALVLAVLIGLMLGALGSGGSIVTLPVLVYAAGVPPHEAVAMSLAIVGATSLAGAWLHYRRGNYHIKAMLIFGASGFAGAQIGSAGTQFVSGSVLMLMFAAVMFVVGAMMLRRGSSATSGRCTVVRCTSAGFAVGVLTGFLGVGGGFLIVPALVLFGGIEPKRAMGASLAIIAINALSGLAGHLRASRLDVQTTAMFLGMALAGMLAGVRISSRVQGETLRRAFAWFVLATALAIAAMNVTRI